MEESDLWLVRCRCFFVALPLALLAVVCRYALGPVACITYIHYGASRAVMVCRRVCCCTGFCLAPRKHPGSAYTQMRGNNRQRFAWLYPPTTNHIYIAPNHLLLCFMVSLNHIRLCVCFHTFYNPTAFMPTSIKWEQCFDLVCQKNRWSSKKNFFKVIYIEIL